MNVFERIIDLGVRIRERKKSLANKRDACWLLGQIQKRIEIQKIGKQVVLLQSSIISARKEEELESQVDQERKKSWKVK